MILCWSLVLLTIIFSFANAGESDIGIGDAVGGRTFMKCPLQEDQTAFEVLPGVGWDNLRNMEMGRVFALNYDDCKNSEDGQFLVSHGVTLTPLKRSYVQLSSDIFQHYKNYTSMTARSINTEVSGSIGNFGGSGSLSDEFLEVKSQQSQTKSITTRVSQRHEKYLANMQPDSPLSQEFLNRLLDIATYISELNTDTMHNNTRIIDYLSDLVVRDFGTHVITSITAGALLSKVDHLNSEYVTKMQSQENTIRAAAGASFAAIFKASVSAQSKVSQTTIDAYDSACSASSLYTMGGPTAGANFSIEHWENHLTNNLVAIDRHGDPIFYVITPRVLPSLPDTVVFQLAQRLQDAVNRYYSANAISGCMDMSSSNYNFMANIDSGECSYPVNNFTLGGIFQVCEGSQVVCGALNQANPATGDFSCSEGFEQVNLFRVLVDCRVDCFTSGVLWWRKTYCSQSCGYLSTSWCSPLPGASHTKGFLMGGIFSDTTVNPITAQSNCPEKFFAVKFGMRQHLCLSVDTQMTKDTSIPIFGGFFSCSAGNPLAVDQQIHPANLKLKSNLFMNSNFHSAYPSRCGSGFSQVFAFVEGSCELTYCIQAGYLNHQIYTLTVKRPPFVHLDFMKVNTSGPVRRQLYSQPDATSGWSLDDKGNWIYLSTRFEAMDYSNKKSSSSSSSSSIGIILSAIFGTIAMGLLTIVAIYYFIKRKPLQIWLQRRQYETLNGDQDDCPNAGSGEVNEAGDIVTNEVGTADGHHYGSVNQTESEVNVRVRMED